MLKLKDSGYDMKFRSEIVFSAKKAYRILIENDKNGIKPLHRSREQMLVDKGAKNNSGYAFWKNNKKDDDCNEILFVTPTPNGLLMNMLKKRDRELNSNSQNKNP